MSLKTILEQVIALLPESEQRTVLQTQMAMLADVKIIDLPEVVDQQDSDIYEMSANGTGSFKESRALMISRISSALSKIPQYVFFSETDGSDINGTGSELNPFQTYEVASASAAAQATAVFPTQIVNAGQIANITGDLVIYPFTILANGVYNVSGDVILDSSWLGASSYGLIRNCQFNVSGELTLELSASGESSGLIIDGLTVGGNVTGNLNISGSGADIVSLSRVTTTPEVTLNLEIKDIFLADINSCPNFNNFSNSVSLGSGICTTYLRGSQIRGATDVFSLNTSSADVELLCEGGTTLYGQLTVGYSSAGGGASSVSLMSESLPVGSPTPIEQNGGTVVFGSSSKSINANFTPANYTPAAGVFSPTILNHLKGIDAKLIIQSYAGSQDPVNLVAGPGIDLAPDGTISASGTPVTVVSFAEMYILPFNTTATDLGGTNNWVKITAGSSPGTPYDLYAAGQLNNFTMSNGRLTCQAGFSQKYQITVFGSAFFSSGVAELVFFEIFKQGVTSFSNSALMPFLIGVGLSTTGGSPFMCQGIFDLGPGEYIDLYTRNNNAPPQNPIIHYANCIISPLSVAGSVGEMQWITVNSSTTMAHNTGYFTDSASQVVLTLPATLVEGEVFEVSGVGVGGWRIAQQAGQQIITTNGQTTVGVGGYIESGASFPKASARLIAINSTTLKLVEVQGADVTVV